MSTSIRRRAGGSARSALVALTAIWAVVLTGCSSGGSADKSASESTGTGTAPPATGSVSDAPADLNLVTPGTLTLMATQDSRPTSFVQDGKQQGLAIDMWDYIGNKLNLKVEYRVMAIDTGLSAIAAGQFDSAATGLVASPERERNLDFSAPWIYGFYGLLVRNDSPVKSLNDMKGKTMAVTKGSDPAKVLKEKYPDIKVREYGDTTSQIVAVNTNQVDGTLLGNNGIAAAVKQYPNLTTVDQVPLPYPNGFPFKKGNTGLKSAVDGALASMMEDGTFVKLYYKWHPGEPFSDRLFTEYPTLKQQVQAYTSAAPASSGS